MADLGSDVTQILDANVDDLLRVPIREDAAPGWLYATFAQVAAYVLFKLFGALTGDAGKAILVNATEDGFDLVTPFTNNYVLPSAFTTTPASDEVLMLHTFVEAVEFPANWTGIQKYVGTNPAATFALVVEKSTAGGAFAAAGTLSFSTGGALTAMTAGGTAISFAAGDTIRVMAPTVADTTVKNLAVTLKGTRS